MDFREIIKDIIKSATPGTIFWGITLSVLGNFATPLVKNMFYKLGLNKIFISRNVAMWVDIVSATLVLSSIFFFIITYVFNIRFFLGSPLLKPFLTIPWLIKFFSIGYGGIFLIYILGSIRKIANSERTIGEFLFGSANLVFYPSILLTLIFYFKIVFELNRGLSPEQIEEANILLKGPQFLLFQAILVSFIILVISLFFKIIKSRFFRLE